MTTAIMTEMSVKPRRFIAMWPPRYSTPRTEPAPVTVTAADDARVIAMLQVDTALGAEGQGHAGAPEIEPGCR
jgi:hypothetical protein